MTKDLQYDLVHTTYTFFMKMNRPTLGWAFNQSRPKIK